LFPCKYIVRATARPDFLSYSLKEFWLIPITFLIRNMYARATKIICHSFTVKKILERAHFPMEKVVVICSGVEKTVRQITKEITELMGFNGEIIFSEARKADMQRSVGSYNKAKTELGWEPKISWEDGLLRTIDFYLGKKS